MPLLRRNWFHVLVALADRDVHGSGIARDVAKQTSDSVTLWPATLYRTLDAMVKAGLIIELTGDRHPEGESGKRRYYRATAKGPRRAPGPRLARWPAGQVWPSTAWEIVEVPGPVRLLAILLRLTPRSFRERHGPQVLEDAAERLRGGSRRSRLLRSTRMALDVLWVAASLRLAPPRARAFLTGRMSMGLAHGVRAIRRSPALALLAVPMVGLGVGAVTTVYSVGTTLLVRPLPFDDPHELLWISNGEWGRGQALSSISVQVSHLQDIQAESRTFTQVAGFHLFDRAGDHTLYGQGEPRRVTRLRVTPGFLPLLGVEPLHGRLFDDEESVYGGPPAILLTHDLWATSFRRDPAIVGRAVTIDDEPVTVVGVLPATFDFPAIFAPGTRTDYLAPFPLSPETDRSGNTLALIGRLASGATLQAAQSELTAIAARHQAVRRNSFEPRASPLRMHLTGSFRSSTFVLAASVALVMLIVLCQPLQPPSRPRSSAPPGAGGSHGARGGEAGSPRADAGRVPRPRSRGRSRRDRPGLRGHTPGGWARHPHPPSLRRCRGSFRPRLRPRHHHRVGPRVRPPAGGPRLDGLSVRGHGRRWSRLFLEPPRRPGPQRPRGGGR